MIDYKLEPIVFERPGGISVMRIFVETPEEAFDPAAAIANGFEVFEANGEKGWRRTLTNEIVQHELRHQPAGTRWKRITEADVPLDRSDRNLWIVDFTNPDGTVGG